MNGVLNLREVVKPTRDDDLGLWGFLQQLVGQPFLFFRESHAGELTIHFGTPSPYGNPKLKHRERGSYVLRFRGSFWQLSSRQTREMFFYGPFTEASGALEPFELKKLEVVPVITPGTLLLHVKPYREAGLFGYGFGLLLVLGDLSTILIRPAHEAPSVVDVEVLPEIADWELLTPYERCLRAGPDFVWEYAVSVKPKNGIGEKAPPPQPQ